MREGSVDLSNKMFVRMAFTKAGLPTAGKYKGMKWTGRGYERAKNDRINFLDGDAALDVSPEEDAAAVLKPCVYKTR